MRSTRLLAVVPVLLTACAYYNGMYNAKHYARQAERSERLGRISEAAERWRVAAIHAESVVARHPRSRWADDAMLIRARALVQLEQWSDAALAAERAIAMAGEEEQRREAWLLLGLAQNGMRRSAEALTALDSAVLSGDAARRSVALLGRGRVLLAAGRPREALEDFRSSREADAPYERARAALAAGDGRLAAVFADSLALRQPFREAQWLLLLDSLERRGFAERASGLTDALGARADVRAGPRARLWLAEGERRLRAGDDAAAAARFRDVERTAGDSIEGRVAAARLGAMDVRAARTMAELEAVQLRLEGLAALGGAASEAARALVRLLGWADSLLVMPGAADAFWFLRAELLRDSLGARAVAGDAFAAMPERFPDSPWTPKGILAAIALGHPAADSLRALLFTRYAANPYARAAAGAADAPERFAALEDSLRITLATAVPEVEGPRPAGQTGPLPEDEPGARARRPAAAAPPPQRPPARPTTRPTIDP